MDVDYLTICREKKRFRSKFYLEVSYATILSPDKTTVEKVGQ